MIIRPQIDRLPASVGLAVSTRLPDVREQYGYSKAPYDANNLALHVGDDSADVERNRLGFLDELKTAGADNAQWLNQVHGSNIIEAGSSDQVPTADGCFSFTKGMACAVLTADCLPILLWDSKGGQVAAVHAGWRGLASGVIAKAVETFPRNMMVEAYLGPAISQPYFEVGIDVVETFFESARSPVHLDAITAAFRPGVRSPLKYQADLYALARAELDELGVVSVAGGNDCSFSNREHFYSYRRSQKAGNSATGRMASLIWLK